MFDPIGGATNFVSDALDTVGGTMQQMGIPLAGETLSWVGEGINSVGGLVGNVAGGITDMFFTPLQTLPEMVGTIVGGFVPIEASPMPPLPMNILPLDVPFSVVQGGVSSGGGVGGGANNIISSMASQVDSMYANIESQINNLNPDSPTYQKDLQNIQLAMSKFTQLTELLSNLQKDLHDMSMSIIRNIKM